MDIQKLRQEFEKLPYIKGILYGSEFGFNESLNEYYHPDHTNHRLNYAFIMGAWMAWQAAKAKAQAVPEGFVVVPKTNSDKGIESMAMRYRHDFPLLGVDYQEAIKSQMRQLYEEAVGLGFYSHKAQESDND